MPNSPCRRPRASSLDVWGATLAGRNSVDGQVSRACFRQRIGEHGGDAHAEPTIGRRRLYWRERGAKRYGETNAAATVAVATRGKGLVLARKRTLDMSANANL
jgi:hypothetical protein